MKGLLMMSEKERNRKVAFEMVRQGKWTLKEAAEHLRLSYRQCRRSYRRFVVEGDAGLVHRSRGRSSNRGIAREMRDAALRRYREVYDGFGPTLAAEKLAEDGYEVDHETLRRWLVAEGLWLRRRRRKPYRSRRQRRAHFGELIQVDASIHLWFGEGNPMTCLLNMVDDATGIRMSLMAEEETTEGYMRLLWRWIKRYGIPKALYTDRKNVFVTDREPTVEEQLAGEEPKTAFGKACAKLGIQIITAHSAQAKGRVERAHGVYQDRLVKELKLQGITTIEGANALLENGFVDNLNSKFAKPPRAEEDFHRGVPEGLDLAQVFCFEEHRVVANDWTISFHRRTFQIGRDNTPRPKPKDKVLVRTLLDGTVELLYRDKPLKYQEIDPGLSFQKGDERKIAAALPVRARPKPAADHPWRHAFLRSRAKARGG